MIRRRISRKFGPLQQRIALKFLIDKLGQLLRGKLQQFDRLQQLRRHDKGLALSHYELGRKRHLFPG